METEVIPETTKEETVADVLSGHSTIAKIHVIIANTIMTGRY